MFLNPFLYSDAPELEHVFSVVLWELNEHLGVKWWRRQRLDKMRALRNILLNLLVCTRTLDGFDEVAISMRPEGYVENGRKYPRHFSFSFYSTLAHALADTGWCVLEPGFWDREGNFSVEGVRFRTRLRPTAKLLVFGSLHPILARQDARPVWEVRDDRKRSVDVPKKAKDRRALRDLERYNAFMAEVDIALPAHLLDAKLVVELADGAVRNDLHLRWRWLEPCKSVRPQTPPAPVAQPGTRGPKRRKKRRVSLRKRNRLPGSFIPLPFPLPSGMTPAFDLEQVLARGTTVATGWSVRVEQLLDVARYLETNAYPEHRGADSTDEPTNPTPDYGTTDRPTITQTDHPTTDTKDERTSEPPNSGAKEEMDCRTTELRTYRKNGSEEGVRLETGDDTVRGPLLVQFLCNTLIYWSLGGEVDGVIRADGMVHLRLWAWRVFNRASTDFGGRFFHQLQSLPSAVRRHLLIDGEEVVELDFKGMHVVMLYHEQGMTAPHDPYAVFDDDRDPIARPLVKTALLTMINAEEADNLPNVVSFNFRKKFEWTTGKVGVLGKIVQHCGSVAEIIEAIKRKHHSIAHHFNTDVGVKLQRKDSEIMQIILNRCLALHIPAIPVHDSVIVARRHEQVVHRIMLDAYGEVMNADIIVEQK